MVALLTAIGGCAASTPAPVGFISDYSRLKDAGAGRMRYISPDLKNYDAFIVDPVQLRAVREPAVLKPKERAEITNYFKKAIEQMLNKRGFTLVVSAGARTARVRFALTDVQKSKWYLNLHPGTKITGAGAGGASMEGEVIDSVTGEQLAAVIRTGRGNQFSLSTFSGLDGAKSAIDKWAKDAGDAMDELHGRSKK